MIGIVIAAHGELAQALLQTASLVVSQPAYALTVSMDGQNDSLSCEQRLQEAIQTAQQGCEHGVLVLTDMFGGTPSNIALKLHQAQSVEVLTGVNLPMLIKALQLSHSQTELSLAARKVRDCGSRAIVIAGEVLQGNMAGVTEKSA